MAGPPYKELPKNARGRHDKKAVRKLFDESPFLEWQPFIDHHNFEPSSARKNFDWKSWVADKKARIWLERTEVTADMFERIRNGWEHDVLNTMEHYPKAIDAVFALTQRQLTIDLARPKELRVGVKRLMAYTQIMKNLVDAKKQILMLNDVQAVIASRTRDLTESQKAGASDDDKPASWMLAIKGGSDGSGMDLEGLKAAMAAYLDKPQIEVPKDPDAPQPVPEALVGGTD